MNDPVSGSQLVTVNTSAGERQFKRLSPADWVSLANIFKRQRKSALRVELATGGADPDEARRQLDAMDRRPVKYRDVEQYVNTLEGQYMALRLAVSRDPAVGSDEDAIEAAIADLAPDPGDWNRIVADLLNLQLVVEELPDPPAGVGAVAPPQPETTAPTGTEPPTGSPGSGPDAASR